MKIEAMLEKSLLLKLRDLTYYLILLTLQFISW